MAATAVEATAEATAATEGAMVSLTALMVATQCTDTEECCPTCTWETR